MFANAAVISLSVTRATLGNLGSLRSADNAVNLPPQKCVTLYRIDDFPTITVDFGRFKAFLMGLSFQIHTLS